MPIDPEHGRNIPAGQRIARIVRELLSRMRRASLESIRRGQSPHFDMQFLFEYAVALVPEFQRHMRQGAADALKAIRDNPTAKTPPLPQLEEGMRQFLPTVRPAAMTHSMDFLKELRDSTQESVRKAIADGVSKGEPLTRIQARLMRIETDGTVADRIAELPAFSKERAYRIAQYESSWALHEGQMNYGKSVGAVGLKWIASSNACDVCLSLVKKGPVPYGTPFYVWENGKEPYKYVYHAPAHPNCVLSDTPVFGATISSAVRAQYKGTVVRIKTSDGSDFAVTPNHMLLTTFGFIRASDLMPGDNILRAINSKTESLPRLIDPNHNNAPPLAFEVFHSLSKSDGMSSVSVPMAAEYLHGDAAFCNGNIDVVRPNGLLTDDIQSQSGQPFNHGQFVLRDVERGFLPSRSNLSTMLKSLLLATNSRMGSSRDSQSVILGGLRKSNKVCFASSSDRQAKFLQSVSNPVSGDIERLRKTQNAFPGFVTSSKVIEIEISELSHAVPVFDFETEETMYCIANGIISSNCRCTCVDVFEL